MNTFSYRDAPGLENRANSAMLTIESIINDTALPSSVRLVLIAHRMSSEPVLTDGSVAAISARKKAGTWRSRNVRVVKP
jgi:hypothetical protein